MAIAIVVDSITDFSLRFHVPHAGHLSTTALPGSKLARRCVGCAACGANSGNIVVDQTVAIVIDAVARFKRGIDVARADNGTGRAYLDAGSTRTNTGVPTARVCIDCIVVDLAVAVVIKAIAVLNARFHRPNADDLSPDALSSAQRARIDAGGAARSAHVREVVINDAVAVVVNAVAGFGYLRGHNDVRTNADNLLTHTGRRSLVTRRGARALIGPAAR